MSPLLLAFVVLQSAVYSWTDKSGIEHFTDDLTSIPRGVKVRSTEGAEISRIENDAPKNVRPATVAPSPSAQPAIPSTSELVWRQLFRDARTRVSELEAEIESDRTKVEEVNGMPVLNYFNCAPYYVRPVVSTGAVVTIGGQPFPSVSVGGTVVGPSYPTPYATPCFYNPEFERLRERLARNRREVVRARDDLADLERRASFEAVPLHWRR